MSKSPSLRRIQADIRELALDPSDRYHAAPLEDDMFEWHFTIRGPEGTEFEGGLYHGRILLPPEYPFKPPHIMFLNHSGRFELNTKICLSFSAYHPELWQPAWGIRLILEALISFLPTPADGAIGALDWTKEERKRLAKKSHEFVCPKCGPITKLIPALKLDSTKTSENGSTETKNRYQKDIELLKLHQIENEKNNQNKKKSVDVKANDTKESLGANNVVKEKAVDTSSSTPTTPAIPTVVTSASAPTTTSATTLVENNTTTASSSGAWLTDPIVHGSIVTFAAIAYILYRKVVSLLDELENLDD